MHVSCQHGTLLYWRRILCCYVKAIRNGQIGKILRSTLGKWECCTCPVIQTLKPKTQPQARRAIGSKSVWICPKANCANVRCIPLCFFISRRVLLLGEIIAVHLIAYCSLCKCRCCRCCFQVFPQVFSSDSWFFFYLHYPQSVTRLSINVPPA